MRTMEATLDMEPMLSRLQGGEPVEIRRGNIPIALFYPVQPARDPALIRKAAEELKELRKGVTLGGLKIRDLIDEGRP